MSFLIFLFCLLFTLNNMALAEGYYIPKYAPMNIQKSSENNNQSFGQVNFEPYMKDLQKEIRNRWQPPKHKERLYVKIFLRIDKNGETSNVKIYQSSMDTQADNAALNAVQSISQFKPLPKEFKGSSIDVIITVGKYLNREKFIYNF